MLAAARYPTTKRELIKALERITPKRIQIYEGEALKQVPPVRELERQSAAVVVLTC